MKRTILALLALLAFTGCGRGTTDLNRAYNLPNRDSAGKVIPDLAAQNRYSLQTSGEYKYFYTSPEAETANPDGKPNPTPEAAAEETSDETADSTETSTEESTEETSEEGSEEAVDTTEMDPTAAVSDKLDALSDALSELVN